MIKLRDRKPEEADDTPRIQEAIDEAAKTSDDIELSAGPYYLATTLQLFNVQHVTQQETQ